MEERKYALFGIFGPLIVYLSIIISLLFSPWFRWESNTLSSLGNSTTSSVAPIFNFGLLISGLFLVIHSLKVFKKHANYTSICLLISAFFIQLLSVFNETYGVLHFTIAGAHFIMLSTTSIVYVIEKKSLFALFSFLVVIFSWLFYILNIFSIGIAIPETVSKLVVLWIVYSSIKIYFGH